MNDKKALLAALKEAQLVAAYGPSHKIVRTFQRTHRSELMHAYELQAADLIL